jgi:alanine dehydrogenase
MRADPPIRLLSERDVRAIGLSLAETIALIEQVYLLDAQGGVEVPMKIGVHPLEPDNILHAMPAWIEGVRALGMKWVSYFPGNARRGLADYSGIIILNDPDSGLPLCILEGMHVTFMRTAACATVAARHILPAPPRSLGLIGCGRLARWTLRMMLCAFPAIECVFVASRTPGSRESFCAEMQSESSAPLAAALDVRSAIEGVDVVVSSIPPTAERPVRAEWLSPGSVFIPLDILNSWRDEVLSVVSRVVSDDPANFRSRLQSKRPNALAAIKSSVALQAVLAGSAPKSGPTERSFVAICGIASTDVIVACEIYRRACAANLGQMFALRPV